MATAATDTDQQQGYRSKRNKLPEIRRKVDALAPKAQAATRTIPQDYTTDFRRVNVQKRGFVVDGQVQIEPRFDGVKFVDSRRGAPTTTRRKAPAKKITKKTTKKTATKTRPKKTAKKGTTRKKAPAKPTRRTASTAKDLRPQCAAATPAGKQCRNSARQGSKYCGSHKGFQPSKATATAKDTRPKVRRAKDTRPAARRPARKAAAKKTTATKNARCAAKTADGKRCKNSSRDRSKYCGSHKGHRP